jgi:hypothetical protein
LLAAAAGLHNHLILVRVLLLGERPIHQRDQIVKVCVPLGTLRVVHTQKKREEKNAIGQYYPYSTHCTHTQKKLEEAVWAEKRYDDFPLCVVM